MVNHRIKFLGTIPLWLSIIHLGRHEDATPKDKSSRQLPTPINTVILLESTDLFVAQPITF
ncbi:MAG: hypothetical protein F6K23_28900 [Okeania sp. SIO2C9]|uniref:hypothetical protein n=1 Tax=Okeania sp. SIO2C9 TaxID=2607791 RepID=UPI0013C0A84F|nr:hypothetical protein [Okeania sp. SIO2C9]NEQ76702.1 hypothetical protein [Okeania sp. SIO2C9]